MHYFQAESSFFEKTKSCFLSNSTQNSVPFPKYIPQPCLNMSLALPSKSQLSSHSLLLPSPLRSAPLPIVCGQHLNQRPKASNSPLFSLKRELLNIEARSCVGLKYLRPLPFPLSETVTRPKQKTRKLEVNMPSGASFLTWQRTDANVRQVFGGLVQFKQFSDSYPHSRAVIVVIEVNTT